MGFSPQFREFVEERLSACVPIRTKAMFGGVGIYSADLFFALIAEDKLFFKVSELNQADFEMQGMMPFFPYDSPTPMGYWELPADVLEDPVELRLWIDKALAVAQSKKPNRKRLSINGRRNR
ncbi:MAG: TfoX/Sxy family protein [Fimbriimonadaceae bacterium]|nr:TfoX/Sxy family protein [Fimbriimonadaceae bacterium]